MATFHFHKPMAHLGTGWNIIAMFKNNVFLERTRTYCHKTMVVKNMFPNPSKQWILGWPKVCSSCLRAPTGGPHHLSPKKRNNRPAKVRPNSGGPWRLQMSKGRLRIPSCHLKPGLLHSELRTESRVLNGEGTCRTESRGGALRATWLQRVARKQYPYSECGIGNGNRNGNGRNGVNWR